MAFVPTMDNLKTVDPAVPVTVSGKTLAWKPAEPVFSVGYLPASEALRGLLVINPTQRPLLPQAQ